MINLAFLVFCGTVLFCLLAWGFRVLPEERWQMLAVVPVRKEHGDQWVGSNLTYYGFFIASSQLLSISLLLILLGSMEISLTGTLISTGALLAFCLPAARLIAKIVEKKNHTFTIGGASFVGIILAPWVISGTAILLNHLDGGYLPLMPVMAAMAIGYTLGEGLGRLGCISFGCCYGKPLNSCSRFTQWLFARSGVIFQGATKKVEYESQLAGERLIPIQAMTCILYTSTALVGSWFYLSGKFTMALIFSMLITQVWRLVSELFRADFRGYGSFTAYQKMGVLAVIYVLGIVALHQPQTYPVPVVLTGIKQLWQPEIIIVLQLTWLLFFFYFGRSTITSSTVAFKLSEKSI